MPHVTKRIKNASLIYKDQIRYASRRETPKESNPSNIITIRVPLFLSRSLVIQKYTFPSDKTNLILKFNKFIQVGKLYKFFFNFALCKIYVCE